MTVDHLAEELAHLAEELARTSAWSHTEWVPTLKRALAAGITGEWLSKSGPALGPHGVHAAMDAANALTAPAAPPTTSPGSAPLR